MNRVQRNDRNIIIKCYIVFDRRFPTDNSMEKNRKQKQTRSPIKARSVRVMRYLKMFSNNEEKKSSLDGGPFLFIFEIPSPQLHSISSSSFFPSIKNSKFVATCSWASEWKWMSIKSRDSSSPPLPVINSIKCDDHKRFGAVRSKHLRLVPSLNKSKNTSKS